MRSTKRILFIAFLIFSALVAAFFLYDSRTEGDGHSPSFKVQVAILRLCTELRSYAAESGAYPTTEQGLSALVNRPTKPPIPKKWHQCLDSLTPDAWGRPYVYRFPSPTDITTFELFSLGPDGVVSADDIRAPQ